MYTINEIETIRKESRVLGLRAPRRFFTIGVEELARIANGYGPERWPIKARKLLTWIFRYYPAPAAIHDLRYEYSNGRNISRVLADAELAANLLLCWQARYGHLRWLNPIAVYAYFKVRAAAALCAKLGSKAWSEAFRKKRQKNSDSGRLF